MLVPTGAHQGERGLEVSHELGRKLSLGAIARALVLESRRYGGLGVGLGGRSGVGRVELSLQLGYLERATSIKNICLRSERKCIKKRSGTVDTRRTRGWG